VMMALDQVSSEEERRREKIREGESWFLSGTVTCTDPRDLYQLESSEMRGVAISFDRFAVSHREGLDSCGPFNSLRLDPRSDLSSFEHMAKVGCLTALQVMSLITHRSLFVVERSAPPNARDRITRIRRANERPIFSILTIGRIQQRFNLGHHSKAEDGSTRTVAAHPRTGHFRYYRHSKYSEERRSRPQWIESTRIGPTEAKVSGHRYLVRTDL
jgi:hypothetical protein